MPKLYFIQGEFSKRIKIGVSTNPEWRLKQLQACSPESLRIMGIVDKAGELERTLHGQFSVQRVHGEWFAESLELLNRINVLCPQAEKREHLSCGSSFRLWP